MGWRERNRPADSYWAGGNYPNVRVFRRIRTTQERRANQHGWCRPRRRPHRLPDARDDALRMDRRHRSWKRQRPTQYRPVS